MICGVDIRLNSVAGRDSLEIAARAVAQIWQKADFADGETGERYDEDWLVPFSEMDEVFVYRDSHYAEFWFEKGAVPEARNQMIHFPYDPGLLTAVIDARDQVMDTAIEAIKSALANDLR